LSSLRCRPNAAVCESDAGTEAVIWVRPSPNRLGLRLLSRWRYAQAEGAMRASVWPQLSAYLTADMATEALLSVLDQAGFEAHESEAEPPASYWRARALLYLGVLAVRTTRAGMVVIASGYEAEAMNHKRGNITASVMLIDDLERQIADINKRLRGGHADHPYVPLLMSAPGIGWVLAFTIAAEIGEIERFSSPQKLTGYTGLCPRVNESGDSDRRGPLPKQGPPAREAIET
jgi:Transposase IS116/IS110/IS902 family